MNNSKTIEKYCLFCGTKFNLHISRKNTAKFCSISCSKKYSWKQIDFRLNIINKLKGRHLSPETEIKKGQHLSPETEIKNGEHISKETEFKKGSKPIHPYTSIELKKLWKDKNYKSYIIRKSMLGRKTTPNKPEKLLLTLLPKSFKYVGDGKLILNGFNPDFIDKRRKLIIELFGDYWHKNTKQRDKIRLGIYKKYGYKTLIIWGKELKNLNKTNQKIKRFIHVSQ
jgi:very-short-patch-repair endonuclease